MPSRGFSLVEMLTIMATVALLVALGTVMFQRYDRSFRREAQTRFILAQLMKARMQAITQHRVIRVKLYPDRFEVYSSGTDDRNGASPYMVQQLRLPLSSNAVGFGGGAHVDFKETGLTDDWCSICVDADAQSPGLDSIVISATRMSPGSKDKGNECTSDNITIR
jgi:Tfp pilus assembly protein FimT